MSETDGENMLNGGHPISELGRDMTDHEDDVTLKEVSKATAEPMPILEATVAPGTSSARPSEGDADSTRSLPTSHPAQRAPSRPSTASGRPNYGGIPAAGVPRTHRTSESSASTGDRANRHRSVTEVRSTFTPCIPRGSSCHGSPQQSRASNRLSGFFSNFIHRRDGTPSSTPRSGLREDRPSTPAPADASSVPVSRSSSPMPARVATPPPPLPAPTLLELGLSLSVVTADLSPSHSSTPPYSGAFLAPHYLLLCHAQGLDVLPLTSPPAPQPYALVRRVSFKSVVVMEQRGVLVAIAGRRDGVRVYALEEVKKAVEWRIEVEVRRERERTRRDEAKRSVSRSVSNPTLLEQRNSSDKSKGRQILPSPPTPAVASSSSSATRNKTVYRSSPPSPTTPKSTTAKWPKPPPQLSRPSSPHTHQHTGQPPPYSNAEARGSGSISSVAPSRRPSMPNVLTPSTPLTRQKNTTNPDDSKTDDDWFEGRGSSDDEAIDIVAAGASGSQALDERTSGRQPAANSHGIETTPITLGNSGRAHSTHSSRRRPANLDLTLTRTNTSTVAVAAPPSPVPTTTSLIQALTQVPGADQVPDTADVDDEDDEAPTRETVSLAQMLMESRIPDLPPVGTRQSQQPIVLGESDVPSSSRDSFSQVPPNRPSTMGRSDNRRRRRWSVLDGFFTVDASSQPSASTVSSTPTHATPNAAPIDHIEHSQSQLVRSYSSRQSPASTQLTPRPTNTHSRPSSAGGSRGSTPNPSTIPPPMPTPSTTPNHSRFIPRIISNAFHSRRSEEQPQMVVSRTSEAADGTRRAGTPTTTHAPPPKLEYVKLPGTKGALMIKAVETGRKRYVEPSSLYGLHLIPFFLVSLLFSAVKTVKKLSYLPALIAQRWAFREHSFCLTPLDLWNCNSKEMIWWKYSLCLDRMCLVWNLLLCEYARLESDVQSDAPQDGEHGKFERARQTCSIQMGLLQMTRTLTSASISACPLQQARTQWSRLRIRQLPFPLLQLPVPQKHLTLPPPMAQVHPHWHTPKS